MQRAPPATARSHDLDQLLTQVADTAQSVWMVAGLLSGHPEALIRGRAARAVEQAVICYRPLMAMALVLTTCSSPSPSLHMLEQDQGMAEGIAPPLIVVRSVAIPRYLERQEIVRDASDGRIVVTDNDWWSEPLATMSRRVLAQDVADRLPASKVIAGESLVGLVPDADIDVSLDRFDPDRGGRVTLTGFFDVRRGDGRRDPQRFHIVAPGAGSRIADQITAMNHALSELADIVTRRLSY